MKRVAYIDGANLHNGTKDLGWCLDYQRFFVWLKDKYKIEEARIFIGMLPERANSYKYLAEIGFKLTFKETLRDKSGMVKGNCDAELIVSAMTEYFESGYGAFILISSDGDFAALLKFLREKNVPTSILSPRNSCSFLLRKLNLPITYLDSQKNKLALHLAQKEKAPGEDETSQGSLS
ncbi:MAG: NYN domain-containing protein [Candidatus Paceibacterota bacterium]|jgi:uncharacterized LabA/DUF88 family protein